jgi:hypothetical protein
MTGFNRREAHEHGKQEARQEHNQMDPIQIGFLPFSSSTP